VITLPRWLFVAALALAAIVGGMGVALLLALLADAEDAPADESLTERD